MSVPATRGVRCSRTRGEIRPTTGANYPGGMRGRWRVIGVAGAFAAISALISCSSDEISADTSCSDFLEHDRDERYDAAIRLTVELDTQDAGNPLWGPNLDYMCGSRPDGTIREVLTGESAG